MTLYRTHGPRKSGAKVPEGSLRKRPYGSLPWERAQLEQQQEPKLYYPQTVDTAARVVGLATEPDAGRAELEVGFDALAREWSWYGRTGGVLIAPAQHIFDIAGQAMVRIGWPS